jgi:hypothetical protein
MVVLARSAAGETRLSYAARLEPNNNIFGGG